MCGTIPKPTDRLGDGRQQTGGEVTRSHCFAPALTALALLLVVFLVAACSGNEGAATTSTAVSETTAVGQATATSAAGSATATTGGPPTTQPGGTPPSTPPSLPPTPPPDPGSEEAAERLPDLQKAVESNPTDLDALEQLAIGYFQAKQYAEAEETYKKLLALKDSAEIHNNLGNVYRDWNKKEEAIEQYEAAMKLDPSLVFPYSNLAALHMMSGDTEKARAVTETGIEKTSGAAQEQLRALLDSIQ